MSSQPLLAWLREFAVPLSGVTAGPDDYDFEPLADLFAAARVVGLGESTHGASELFKMKHRLIEFLIKRCQFNVVAFEASYSGSTAIDDFVRYDRGDLDTALTGQGYTAWDTEEVTALLRWLHDHNSDLSEDRRTKFWGLDSGYNANGRQQILGYLDITAPELAVDISPTFDALNELEARWPFLLDDAESDLAAAHLKLQELRGALARTKASSTDLDADQVTRYLRQMVWWTGPDRNARSRNMGTSLLELIDTSPPDTKVVVWAHNFHVGRGSDRLGKTLGDLLNERFGQSYVPVSLEFGTGQCHQRSLNPDLTSGDLVVHEAGPAPVGSLPWCLAATGAPAQAITLRDRPANPAVDTWFAEPQTEHAIGWTFANWAEFESESMIAEKYDAIVYVDTVTPSHPTPNATRAIARHERY
jgi:erythromycin esterase